MRKSQLLERIPKTYPEHNSCRIIRASGQKVLMTILPSWEVINRQKEKVIFHFTWKDGYLTYYPSYNEWTREQLSTLYYNAYLSQSGLDEKSIETVRNFTGKCYASIDAVICYESEIRYEKNIRALQSKQKRIDRKMKDVPALPKDFRRFCEKKLKASGLEKINIKLFQPYNGRMMERIFSVTNYRGRGNLYITELCRAYQRELAGSWTEWYYGEKFGRVGARQHFWDKKRDTCVGNLPTRHFVYDNLDSIEMTNAQRDTLRLLDGRCDPTLIIKKVSLNPQIEYIAKKGCLRLAAELVDKYRPQPIKISALTCNRLKAFDGGIDARELLEAAPKINDRYLSDFCKIKDSSKASMIIGLAKEYNINHVYALLLKTGGMTIPNINEYQDYLRMALRLGNNPRDEIIYRNKNWHEWHDRYAAEIDRKELKNKNRKENKEYKNISIDYKLNKALFSWEDDNYIILVPKNAGEINEEGRKQHHCVGAQSQYKDKMNRRQTFIVFLRKKEDPKKPYYTIECDLKKVLQFYAAYDRQPDKEKVQKILSKWMKQVKKNNKELSKAAV